MSKIGKIGGQWLPLAMVIQSNGTFILKFGDVERRIKIRIRAIASNSN